MPRTFPNELKSQQCKDYCVTGKNPRTPFEIPKVDHTALKMTVSR